jgi:hypothetical protein
MDVCLLCVVRQRSLWRADHLSRGVLLTVACSCVWSRNLMNEEAIACAGLQSQMMMMMMIKCSTVMTYHLCKTGRWNLHWMVCFKCFITCNHCDIGRSNSSDSQDSNLGYYTALVDKQALTRCSRLHGHLKSKELFHHQHSVTFQKTCIFMQILTQFGLIIYQFIELTFLIFFISCGQWTTHLRCIQCLGTLLYKYHSVCHWDHCAIFVKL